MRTASKLSVTPVLSTWQIADSVWHFQLNNKKSLNVWTDWDWTNKHHWLQIPLQANVHCTCACCDFFFLPCAAVWAWSPWWTRIYRAHSSECQSSWSTAVDRPGGRSAGSPCSGMVWSEDSRHRLHSDKSCGSQKIQSTLSQRQDSCNRRKTEGGGGSKREKLAGNADRYFPKFKQTWIVEDMSANL